MAPAVQLARGLPALVTAHGPQTRTRAREAVRGFPRGRSGGR